MLAVPRNNSEANCDWQALRRICWFGLRLSKLMTWRDISVGILYAPWMDGISRYTMFVYGNPSFDCLGLPSISYYLALWTGHSCIQAQWTGIALISVAPPSRFASEQSVYCVLIPSLYLSPFGRKFRPTAGRILCVYASNLWLYCIHSHSYPFILFGRRFRVIPGHFRRYFASKHSVYCIQLYFLLFPSFGRKSAAWEYRS